MKTRILLLLIVAAVPALAQNEIPQGSFYGTLSLGFTNQKLMQERKNGNITIKDDPSTYSSWEISPGLSYFIMNNFSIGLYAGMSGSKSTTVNTAGPVIEENINKTSGPAFGVFARKFWNLSDNFYTYVGLGVDYVLQNGTNEERIIEDNTTTITTTESETTNLDVALNIGLAYHISERVMLIGSFGVLSYYVNNNKYNITADSYRMSNYKGVQLDVSTGNIPFNLGFNVLLNSNKGMQQP